MAHQRKTIPQDPPEFIAVRARMKPMDWSKTSAPREYLDQWHLKWVNINPQRIAEQQAKKGYAFVEPKELPDVEALGDKTSKNRIVHGDLVLMKRPKEAYDKEQREDAFFHEFSMKSRMQGTQAEAESAGIRLRQDVKIGQGEDTVTIAP